MPHASDYEREDRAALAAAHLALLLCPYCRRELYPVALLTDGWGCEGRRYPQHTPETWYLPAAGK